MYQLQIHKSAQKSFQKSPKRIKEKVFECLQYLILHGTQDLKFPIEPLQGKFKKFHYFEIKLDKDYRIFFRREGNQFFIRQAGTHNSLGTG